jgi:hypothetical protein
MIAVGASVDYAAAKLRITRRLVARYAREHPDFRAQLDATRRERDAKVRAGLQRMQSVTRSVMAGEPATGEPTVAEPTVAAANP